MDATEVFVPVPDLDPAPVQCFRASAVDWKDWRTDCSGAMSEP